MRIRFLPHLICICCACAVALTPAHADGNRTKARADRHKTPTSAVVQDSSIHAGEIGLSGTVDSIDSDNNSLVILVSSFSLHNGRSHKLAVLKTRTGSFRHPEIVAASAPAAQLPIDYIRPRTRIMIIGRDKPGVTVIKIRKIVLLGR